MIVSTPQLQFTLDLGSPIWQIRADFEGGLLALEIRDGDRLQTDFAVLDVASGKLTGPRFRSAENWWVGLEDIQERRVYIHGFADRKVGSHQGITAINVDSQQVLWQQEQAVFYGLADGQKIIARPAPNQSENFMALDSRSGTILEATVSPEAACEAVAAFTQARSARGLYPVHHPEGSDYFTLLGQFVSSRTGCQPVGAIDYLETISFFVVAYYVPAGNGKLKNIAGVYTTGEGMFLGEVVLSEAAAGLGTGSFFMMQETLILVQEKNKLVGYRL